VCIWVGGFAVSDLPRSAGLRVNDAGQILVDRALRSLSQPEIFAVGDAAMPAEDPGTPMRMSLYAAGPMGAHAADALAAHLRGRQLPVFGLSYLAQGLSLGRRDGVVQFLHWDTDTATAFIITGRIANWFREFFVSFLLLNIRLQRTVPWVFFWPGKYKMRSRAGGTLPQEPAHMGG
jgi:NADH:quinone reductase (non-electrogenic)